MNFSRLKLGFFIAIALGAGSNALAMNLNNTVGTVADAVSFAALVPLASDISKGKVKKKIMAAAMTMAVAFYKQLRSFPPKVRLETYFGVCWNLYAIFSTIVDKLLPSYGLIFVALANNPELKKEVAFLLAIGCDPNNYIHKQVYGIESYEAVRNEKDYLNVYNLVWDAIPFIESYWHFRKLFKDYEYTKHPLQYACENGDPDVVKLLIAHKADVNRASKSITYARRADENDKHVTLLPLETVAHALKRNKSHNSNAFKQQLDLVELLAPHANEEHRNKALMLLHSLSAHTTKEQRAAVDKATGLIVKEYDWKSLQTLCADNARNANLEYFRSMLKSDLWRSESIKKAFKQSNFDVEKLNSLLMQGSPQAKREVIIPLHINMRAANPAIFDKKLCGEVASYL